MSKLSALKKSVRALRNTKKGAFLTRFFKTGKGEYAEGDIFYGISVPVSRTLAREFQDISLADATMLLKSPIHEERLIALHIAVRKYAQLQKTGTPVERAALKDWYLANLRGVNNWDLVDSSARYILGAWLLEQFGSQPVGDDSRHHALRIVWQLADSRILWERRVAMIACHALILAGRLELPLAIAEHLLRDEHDLMHKAVGWMLREVGKQDISALRHFLGAHVHQMPRTSLRYAIERMSAAERKRWMRA